MLKLCENNDGRPAVGTGIRPIKYCRACHVAAYGDQFQQWRVVFRDLTPGEREEIAIACAKTGEDIQAGGTVWLDPVETRIDALVYAGFIEALPTEKPVAPAKAAKTEA